MNHPGDRVHVLVTVVVAMISAVGDAVVVRVALRQTLVGDWCIENCTTDTWLFMPLDVTV